ncbi:Serpine2 isoform C [Columba livia]|nr:Serpine2 isoform C [Columba livia]
MVSALGLGLHSLAVLCSASHPARLDLVPVSTTPAASAFPGHGWSLSPCARQRGQSCRWAREGPRGGCAGARAHWQTGPGRGDSAGRSQHTGPAVPRVVLLPSGRLRAGPALPTAARPPHPAPLWSSSAPRRAGGRGAGRRAGRGGAGRGPYKRRAPPRSGRAARCGAAAAAVGPSCEPPTGGSKVLYMGRQGKDGLIITNL